MSEALSWLCRRKAGRREAPLGSSTHTLQLLLDAARAPYPIGFLVAKIVFPCPEVAAEEAGTKTLWALKAR